MTTPLPPEGGTDWFPWASWVHAQAVKVADDSGWVNIAPATGWATGSQGARGIRKQGVYFFQLNQTRTSWTAGTPIATLPYGPTYRHWFVAQSGALMDITSTGVLTATSDGGGTIAVSGSFPIG